MDQNPLYDEVILDDGELYAKDRWLTMPQIYADDRCIHGFFGQYRWLSNFRRAAVKLDGLTYPAVENAYQAAKFPGDIRAAFTTCTARDAIKLARSLEDKLSDTDGWNLRKMEIMESLLIQKFDPGLNPELSALLQATGERHLEETNWWGDVFWGVTLDGTGENHLGKLLLGVRQRLR